MSQTSNSAAQTVPVHYGAHIEYAAYSSASTRAETQAEAMSAVLDMAEYYSGQGHQIRELRVEESCARCAGSGRIVVSVRRGVKNHTDCGTCKGAGYKTLISIYR